MKTCLLSESPLALFSSLRSRELPPPPLQVRQWIGGRIKELTGSTGSPDAFAHPAGDEGLFGPQAMTWRVHAHFVGMLVGGLSSLLLQALHPRALAAVWDHSNFRDNLKGRLGRTAYFVAISTYGGRDDALHAIERVNRIHAKVQGHMPDGTPYVANEPDLLRWVHLGEVSSFLRGYQLFSLQALTDTQADNYVREMALTGELLGAGNLPLTVIDCDQGLNDYRDQLVCNERTREIVRVIENYPVDLWDKAFMHLVIKAAFHTLPDWALHMLDKPVASALEKQLVRQALKLAGLPVQTVLDEDGVAAQARRRVATRSSAAAMRTA